MKIYYSILLLACIALKPVYFMSYVGYFEANKEYIIKKYCVNKSKPKLKCNGKCHLSKKLNTVNIAEIDTTENQFKALLHGFKNVFTPLYFVEEDNKIDLIALSEYKKEFENYIAKKYSIYPSITSPPPKI